MSVYRRAPRSISHRIELANCLFQRYNKHLGEKSTRKRLIMIIEFRTGNFLSIKDPVTLSMLSSKSAKEFNEQNIFQRQRFSLLRCAAIYGANASGKSNLLNALVFMRWFTINSSKGSQATEEIEVHSFRLDTSTEEQPSLFEVTFLLDNIRYRYGFEVDKKQVRSEWLFKATQIKETALFLRENDGIEVKRGFLEGRGIEKLTRDNVLFLSVVASFNGSTSIKIVEWFRNITPMHGLHEEHYEKQSIEMLRNDSTRIDFIKFIQAADLGIQDIIVRDEELNLSQFYSLLTDEGQKKLPKDLDQSNFISINTVHNKYDGTKIIGNAKMDLSGEESDGTSKFFKMAGPILQALIQGEIIIIDELEAKLHPLLTRAIVQLFITAETNPNNAQLIFATHDTNLLRNLELRRDQIWFTEKTKQEATELYSLAEIILPKGTRVRKDARFDKEYFRGRYGAIPHLGDLNALVKEIVNGQSSKVNRPE